MSILFFFVWGILQWNFYCKTEKSELKTRSKSRGTDLRKKSLALLTKACATTLPYLPIWEYDQLFREFTKDKVSWIKWPIDDFNWSLFRSAFMTISESPLKMEFSKPSSCTSKTTCLVARSSTVYTEEGFQIFLLEKPWLHLWSFG